MIKCFQFGNQIVLTKKEVDQPVLGGEQQLVQEETITTQQFQQHAHQQHLQQQHQHLQPQQQLPQQQAQQQHLQQHLPMSQVETITVYQPQQSEAEQLGDLHTLEKVVRLPDQQTL